MTRAANPKAEWRVRLLGRLGALLGLKDFTVSAVRLVRVEENGSLYEHDQAFHGFTPRHAMHLAAFHLKVSPEVIAARLRNTRRG